MSTENLGSRTLDSSRHQHVMYASPSHIRQLYTERYGNLSQIEIGDAEETSSSVEGKLGSLIAQLKGNFSGSLSHSEIHTINFDDDVAKIKRVVNDLISDENIPKVGELFGLQPDPTQMYRFSSQVILNRTDGEFDDLTIIEVVGFEDSVKFRGKTSSANWGSISDTLTALEAMDAYPVQGVLTPVTKLSSDPEHEEWAVNFLFVCTPTAMGRKRWYNRQFLVDELREELESEE